jgi:UDP-N-acetylglucosamine acyltransferase
MATTIHPTAIIHPKAALGADVTVGPYCVVEERVELGDRCVLDAFVQVKSFVRMGSGNRVSAYAVVGGEPQDLKFAGEESWLYIGDNNRIREHASLHRGTGAGGGSTSIGSGCLLMGSTHIAHDCHLGDGVILSQGASLAGHILVGDQAIIGGMSGIHQFVRVGEHAFVGAMTGVGQDVPPYMLAIGARAKLHGPNLIGMQRKNVSPEARAALKKAYKLIWRSGTPRQDALAEVEANLGGFPEVACLLHFIRTSERGVLSADDNGEE